jgi:hypothetical protein
MPALRGNGKVKGAGTPAVQKTKATSLQKTELQKTELQKTKLEKTKEGRDADAEK